MKMAALPAQPAHMPRGMCLLCRERCAYALGFYDGLGNYPSDSFRALVDFGAVK